VSGLPVVILRCTFRLANAVSVGTILASRQVMNELYYSTSALLWNCT